MDRNPSLPFHFQPRTQKVDLWSISTVDVDRVVRQVDVETLQNHINMVTFCSLQEERCWRCQNPLDPSIIRLFQLAQLSVEWLNHCQGNMRYELMRVKEKLAAADMENQKLQLRVKELTAELQSREKIIRSQQLRIPPETMSLVKCPHCNKIFMNSSYLQKHMKRDHAKQKERLHTTNHKEAEACERTSLTKSCKMELSGLKEQLAHQQQAVHVNNEQLSEVQGTQSSHRQDFKRSVRQPRDMERTLKEQITEAQREQVEKFERRLQLMQTQHESENSQVQNELRRIQSSLAEHQEMLKTVRMQITEAQRDQSEELQLKQVQPECEGQVTSESTCTSPQPPHGGTALGPGWQPPRQTPGPSSPLESENIQVQNELRRVQSSLAEHQEMLKTVRMQITEAQRDQSEELQLKQVQPECEGQVMSESTCTSPQPPHGGTALGPGWQPPRQTPGPSSPLESENIQVLKEVQTDSSSPLSEDQDILKTVTEQTVAIQKAQESWFELRQKIMELKQKNGKPQVLNEVRRMESSL